MQRMSLLATVFLISGCAAPETPSVDLAAETSAVESAIEAWFDTFESQSFEGENTITTTDFEFLSSGGTISFADLKTMFTDHITNHTINISNIDARISGDATLAFATLDEQTSYDYDGERLEQDAVFTVALEKVDSMWRVNTVHRTVLELEEPMEEEM